MALTILMLFNLPIFSKGANSDVDNFAKYLNKSMKNMFWREGESEKAYFVKSCGGHSCILDHTLIFTEFFFTKNEHLKR